MRSATVVLSFLSATVYVLLRSSGILNPRGNHHGLTTFLLHSLESWFACTLHSYHHWVAKPRRLLPFYRLYGSYGPICYHVRGSLREQISASSYGGYPGCLLLLCGDGDLRLCDDFFVVRGHRCY